MIDPALSRLVKPDPHMHIDPALFEIEGIVNDVRRGKVKLEDHEAEQQEHHGHLEEDEIDPALREIVNSLTNAQQVGSVMVVNKSFMFTHRSLLLGLISLTRKLPRPLARI